MTEWISVKDRLPKRETEVLGYFKHGKIYVVAQCSWRDNICNEWHFSPASYDPDSAEFEELTHWMPLPNPPENKEIYIGFDLGKKDVCHIMTCYRPKEIERCNGSQCEYKHEWTTQ